MKRGLFVVVVVAAAAVVVVVEGCIGGSQPLNLLPMAFGPDCFSTLGPHLLNNFH